MFSLDDGMRYWLFTEPTDMRKSFHMLSGIVNNQMSFDLRNGDMGWPHLRKRGDICRYKC